MILSYTSPAFIQNSFDKIIKITIRTETRPELVLVASQGLQARQGRGLEKHQVGQPSEGQRLQAVLRLGASEATSLVISIDKVVEITIRAKPPPDLVFASLGNTLGVLSRVKSDDNQD